LRRLLVGAWNQADACTMEWGEGGVWFASLELPAGGVFFYKVGLWKFNAVDP
jgi:hypothetical protein